MLKCAALVLAAAVTVGTATDSMARGGRGHGHWGHGVVTGGAGYAAAHVVPSSEECFFERRSVRGVLRLVRVCADPYR